MKHISIVKKIIISLIIIFAGTISLHAFDDSKYPIKGIHNTLGLSCTDCHKEKNKEDYSSSVSKSCASCHGDPKDLADKTGHLGHTNNIHNSPHWKTAMNCSACHKAHQPTQNLCVQCHEQDGMKRLIVK